MKNTRKYLIIILILIFIVSSFNSSILAIKTFSFINSNYSINSTTIFHGINELDYRNPLLSIYSDNIWPMYMHDNRHSGQSSYSTQNNTGIVKWTYQIKSSIKSSPIIGDDDTIYFGGYNYNIYAMYLNGTLKWKIKLDDIITETPTLSEEGVLYIGTVGNHFYAIDTVSSSILWDFDTGESIYSSVAIGDNGTIYFCAVRPGRLFAMNPNGTVKWYFDAQDLTYISPAIDNDGIVYFTSNDRYLYAIYPSNGSMKWRYRMGEWCGSPAIDENGVIYVSAWDDYVHSVWPNGTRKWRHEIDWGGSYTPAIGTDGTIYVGQKYLYAINPDGTRYWTFEMEEFQEVTTSCAISSEGTIFFGSSSNTGKGGYLYAVSSEGEEIWKQRIHNQLAGSSPTISRDGTVLVGSDWVKDDFYGILFAIGPLSPDAPEAPTIIGKSNGKAGETYKYTFTAIDPNGDDIYFLIEWGDGDNEEWIGPFVSGEPVEVNHSWSERGQYTIRARAKDPGNNWGHWSELEVSMPYVNIKNFNWVTFQNMFPFLARLLNTIDDLFIK